jgi:hypothetical protein
MGIEDRDWYRDKQIDWERGGLRKRNSSRGRLPKYAWWILVAIIIIAAVVLFRSFRIR